MQTFPTLCSLLAYSPYSPPTSPLLGGGHCELEWYGGREQCHQLEPAKPSATGRILPTTCPVTTCLSDLHQECMDNCSWACVLYEVHSTIEKLTFIPKMAAPAAAPPSSHQPGWWSASERKWAHNRRQKKAWAERRYLGSDRPLPVATVGEEATAAPHHYGGSCCHNSAHTVNASPPS